MQTYKNRRENTCNSTLEVRKQMGRTTHLTNANLEIENTVKEPKLNCKIFKIAGIHSTYGTRSAVLYC
jgi:hypothetical protein